MIVEWFLPRRLNEWLYLLASLAILAGLILSIVSLLRVCIEECAPAHNWKFFGHPFEYFGIAFFTPLLVLHGVSLKNEGIAFLVGLMLAGALGAEAHFVWVQKFEVKSFCPVCLSIATAVLIASLCYFISYAVRLKSQVKHRLKEEYMTSVWKSVASVSVFTLGFLFSILGVAKFDAIAAQENSLKESLYFGNKESPIAVYMFTDWACPACRELEPELEKMTPQIMKKAKITFVDLAIHPETFNYSPYNVSFMLRNKPQYFALRRKLTSLSTDNSNPTDGDIEKIAASEQVKYQHLSGSDIAISQSYFKQLGDQFNIDKTPVMVIVNTKTKKGKKLTGIPEITESNVLKAIQSLEKS